MKPIFAKSLSKPNTSRIFFFFATTKLAQSTTENSWSEYLRKISMAVS